MKKVSRTTKTALGYRTPAKKRPKPKTTKLPAVKAPKISRVIKKTRVIK